MVAKVNRDKGFYGINSDGSPGSLSDEDLGHQGEVKGIDSEQPAPILYLQRHTKKIGTGKPP